MGKIFLGVLFGIGIVIVLVGIATRAPKEQDTTGTEPQLPGASSTEGSPLSRTIEISAPQLYAAYQANEVAADNEYRGKQLVVNGQVSTIRKDFADQIILELATYQSFESLGTVTAYLGEGYATSAAQLQKGEVITVTCVGAGMVIGSPILKNCSVRRTQAEEVAAEQRQFQQSREEAQKPDSDGIYKVGNGISEPQLISSVEAEFSEEAKRDKFHPVVLVNLIVDAQGSPQNVTVDHPVGEGLDDEAIRAVKQYKFKPAINESTEEPVPVQINVQVNFRLY